MNETVSSETEQTPTNDTNPAAGPGRQDPNDTAAEIARLKDMALRAHADLDNFRKRAAREKEESLRFANARLLEDLLPVLDSFHLGLDAARQAGAASAVVEGFEMVRRRLEDFLRDHGVEPVPAEGQTFDPSRHEAVGHEPHSEIPEGAVVRQLRAGYTLRDRLLRPATVVVSKGAGAS
jgi:molecular chaperone GrpE